MKRENLIEKCNEIFHFRHFTIWVILRSFHYVEYFIFKYFVELIVLTTYLIHN